MIIRTRTKRHLTLESLFTMPSEPESKPFYTYADGDDVIEVLNDTFTLVLSRDIRKNARIAAQMSFAIARENPDLDVWYVNTYAGIALLKEAFAKELEKSGMPLPQPIPEPDEAELIAEPEPEPEPAPKPEPKPRKPSIEVNRILSDPTLYRIGADGRHELREDRTTEEEREWFRNFCNPASHKEPDDDGASTAWQAEFEDEDDNFDDDDFEDDDFDDEPDEPSLLLPNFFIHDVPLGTWNTATLAQGIRKRSERREEAAETSSDSEMHTSVRGAGAVVVMNSFEFASMNRGQRERCVMQLAELRDKLGLTFVIFSHEMKRDLAAGVPGRGPLGVVAAKAGAVIRMNDPFEHLIRSRKSENGPKQAGSGVIHEAQMRSTVLQAKNTTAPAGAEIDEEEDDTLIREWGLEEYFSEGTHFPLADEAEEEYRRE